MKPPARALFDLRGLVWHAYYSGDPLDFVVDEAGVKHPKAVHGLDQFIRQHLKPVLETFQPINIIAVEEGAFGNSRRRAWLSQYKERKSQDEGNEVVKIEKEKLTAHVRKLLLALGCSIVKTAYAEADDTIAYLCERLQGGKVVYTVDNDLLQLIQPDKNIAVVVKGHYRTEYVQTDVPAMPLLSHNPVCMYKSLVGDTSDNYGGVRGFGKKAWCGIVERYGYDGIAELEQIVAADDYEKLVAVIQETGDKTLQKVYESRNEWANSYKLAKLHPEWCEASYGDKVVRPKWEKRVPTLDRLRDALDPLGLCGYVEDFRHYTVQQWLMDAPRLARAKRVELLKTMRESPFVPFDYESYDSLQHAPYQRAKRSGGYVDVLSQKITGCSFAFGENLQFSFYMPVKHRDTYNCNLDDLKQMLDSLDGCDLVAHNSMFEQTLSKTNMDMDFPRMLDTLVMSSYVDENMRHGLKMLSKHYLNYDQTTYREIVPEGKDMRDISGAEVMAYGCDDSIVCAHLAVLFKLIMECEQTWAFFYQNEPYFEKAMLPGFIKGIPLDWERLAQLHDEDNALYEKTDAKLRALLTEHCSEINMDGFMRLWPEIEAFERKKMEAKEKSEESILESLEAKKAAFLCVCKYTPNEPPFAKADRKTVGIVAKALNLPGIRSLKEEWIETYYAGIQRQLAAGEATASAEQIQFIDSLYSAVIKGTEEAITHLEAWMTAFIGHEKTLWLGDQLSARSPKQMAELFYGKMGLPILVRNVSKDGKSARDLFELEGAPSTNENAVRTWMTELPTDDWQYQILDAVLALRGINTRISLYYNPYPLWRSPVDGRIHPQIKNCGTVTRRPSGTSPNVLQVSKTKDEGHTRGVFLPQSVDQEGSEQELIVSIDFVQQELVIMAGESDDTNLRACYSGPMATRRDVHTSTGVTIYNLRNKDKPAVDYTRFAQMIEKHEGEEVADLTKRPAVIRKVYAKRTNFLASYGGGALGLARKLIVPKEVAEQFLDGFFAAYPKVKDYQDRCSAQAKRYGFSTSCFKTRRHLSRIHDLNKFFSKSAERQAGNFPIQGGAADVLKIVMRKLVKEDVMHLTGATLLAPIYDELVLSCPVSTIYKLVDLLANIMEMELPGLGIKLDTSVSIGKNWGEQIELGSRPTEVAVNKCIHGILNQDRLEAVA